MKKRIIATFLAAIILSASFLILTSCGPNFAAMDEYERAFAILEFSEERMNKIASYTIDTESKLDIRTRFSKISQSITSKTLCSSDIFGNLAYTTTSESTSSQEYSGSDEIISSTLKASEGYIEGKMFRTGKINGESYAMWSSITAQEYIDHLNLIGGDSFFDIDSSVCKTATATQNDSGTWTATFSDFTDGQVKKYNDAFGGIDRALGDDFLVKNYVITMEYDQNFYVQKMNISCVFEENPASYSNIDLPTAYMSMTYKDLNSTKKPELPTELEGVEESYDLRAIGNFTAALDSLLEYDSASFILAINQTASKKQLNYSETDNVSFSGKNGELEYDIEAKVGNYYVYISYKDGVKDVRQKQNGNTVASGSEESDIETEVRYIDGLLIPISISTVYIDEIAVIDEDEGICELIMNNPDESIVMSLISDITVIRSAKATITPYYGENGELEKYKYRLESVVYSPTNGTVDIKITFTVEITEHS